MKPLHILFLTNRIPWPLNDGGSIAMYQPAAHLRKRGHQVSFACLNTLKHRQDPKVMESLGKVYTTEIDTSLSAAGALKGLFTRMPYNVARFRSATFAALLTRLLKEQHFDLVQMEGIYMALYAETIKTNQRIPLLLRSHNIEHQIWQRLAANTGNPLKKFYLRNLAGKIERFEKENLHHFDAILPITSQDENWYRQQGYQGLLETVNAGVDAEVFKPVAAVPPPVLSFLGSLEWMPNVEGLQWFVQKVWPLVRSEIADARFVVAGKNPPAEVQFLQQPGIEFKGMVADAAAFLQQSGIFVVPLFSGGGMRLKIIEAMAAGLCVVSTAVGAEGIRFTEGREMFLAEGEQAFANKIVTLLRDAGLRASMSAHARQLACEKYSWDSLAAQTEGVYRRLV